MPGNAVSSVGILWGTTPQTRTCGDSVGRRHAAQPGSPATRSTRATPTARPAGQDPIAVRASPLPPVPAGPIMLSRTTGACASCHRRHARHLDEQQPGHRTAAPAHPGEALTTDPADASQHPKHPLPPTPASLQQRVTTPGMPRTDSTRRSPNRRLRSGGFRSPGTALISAIPARSRIPPCSVGTARCTSTASGPRQMFRSAATALWSGCGSAGCAARRWSARCRPSASRSRASWTVTSGASGG